MSLDRRTLLVGLPAALLGLTRPHHAPAKEPQPPHAIEGGPPSWTDRVLLDPGTRRRIRLRLRLPAATEAHRVSDCRYAIGQCLTAMGLEGAVDPARIGIAGHSFGALT